MKKLPFIDAVKNPTKAKSTQFAHRVVNMVRYLQKEKSEFILTRQLIRSGTSIGANVREAEFAESGPDFIHKLAIARKEAGESLFWIELLYAGDYLEEKEFISIYNDAEELIRLLTSSILTRRKHLKTEQLKAGVFLLIAGFLSFFLLT